MTNTQINANRSGLILGTFLGGFHLLWSLLVAGGYAQSLLDFVYRIHFLNNPFTVGTFDAKTALILVLFTAVCGYVFGWVLSMLWNRINKK
jgi:hypothetical protein